MPAAHDIYQTHLDALSDAVWRRDRGAIAALLDARIDVVTGDERFLSVDRDPSVDTLVGFADAMRGRGATGYHRVCTAAAHDGPAEISGSHMTYILRGGNYVIEPYSCDTVLVLRDGVWVMRSTRVDRPYLGAAAFNPPRARAAAATNEDTPT